MSDLRDELLHVERTLDEEIYRPGPWLTLVDRVAAASEAERRALAPDVTRISNKVHGRKGPRTFSFERALASEILAAFVGLGLLTGGALTGSLVSLVGAAVVLAVALQPLLKVATGLGLGLQFSYGYIWKGEPRFKLCFGSYLAASRSSRVIYHLSGILGSPFGWLLAGAVAGASHPVLATTLFLLAAGHLLFQVGIFVAVLAGVSRMPVIGLLRFSSAGGAAQALRSPGTRGGNDPS